MVRCKVKNCTDCMVCNKITWSSKQECFQMHILIFLCMYSFITVVLCYVYEELVTYRFCIWQLWGFHNTDVETSGLLSCYTGWQNYWFFTVLRNMPPYWRVIEPLTCGDESPYVPLKFQRSITQLFSITTQMTWILRFCRL